MKIVRESLNEFHQTGDPLGSLKIGALEEMRGHVFPSYDKLVNYILSILPLILGTTKIPDDILHSNNEKYTHDRYINEQYWSKISDFLIDYGITVNDENPWIDKALLIRRKLIKMGYNYIKQEDDE